MNPAQTQLYLRTWSAAWKANWRTDRGCVQALHDPARSELAQAVEDTARVVAHGQHRAPKQDDIRHAVHRVALGRDKSSKDFSNGEFDRVLCLLRLLIDPDNLAERVRWDNPDHDARHRLVYAITRYPEAYVRTICLNKFRTSDIQQLTTAQLRMLAMTLRQRNPQHAPGPVRKTTTIVSIEKIDEPF